LLSTCFIFFFQAEDGIRDRNVTGVQTCALPILADLELAYSPQVGSAKDPVNIAGYIADNRRHGQLSVQWHEVEALQEAGWLVVDVRTPGEFERGAIPGAVNIPVDELRERAGEIPAGAKVIAQCRVGLRGNVATQLLA